ncbi:MAG: integrase [Ktedonobacteraceae bacterium]
MPTPNEMTIDERRKYVKLMAPRYRKAKRSERSALLSEMEQVSKLHRKHVIRLLNAESLERKKRSTPRSRTYGIEVERVVLRVWESVDYICAERLTPSLVRMARHLAGFGSLVLTAEVESQLATVSPSTVERMLRKNRARKARLPRPGPHRANQVTKGVPMGRIPWNTPDPGHFETDLVHHGGESASGEYGHTLQLIDVATGWSERVMLLGRGYQAMERAFHQVLERLPFAVKELHPDNGTEFFNAHLVRFWKERVSGVQLSRSRPYQKNDNRNVEQKNDTLVRHYFGKLRLDTAEQIAAGNVLYERMWLYYNLFQPVMHLSEKIVEGDTVRRKWDEAQTPYQRLLATGALSQEQQERLQTLYEQTNPLLLREEIYTGLTVLWEAALAQNETAA